MSAGSAALRIIIEQPVFRSADVHALSLLAVFEVCLDARHALLTDPLFDEEKTAPVNDWLRGLPESQRRLAESVLRQGPTLAAMRHRLTPMVRVRGQGQQASHWRGTPPCLTVPDALRLLRTPLKLMVENRRNDRAFLLWLASPSYRRAIAEAEAKGWLEFVHAGGINEMLEQLKELDRLAGDDSRAWIERLRLWLLFDRDSRKQDRSAPSDTSNKLLETSASLAPPWPVMAHQLARRSIENYLPEHALYSWAEDPARTQQKIQRRHQVRAFFQASPAARDSFNVKKGLLGDLPKSLRDQIRSQSRPIHDHELDPLFRPWSPEAREHLKNGFGDLGQVFRQLHGDPPQHLRESETLPASIFERL
jgi:hypothetical protein